MRFDGTIFTRIRRGNIQSAHAAKSGSSKKIQFRSSASGFVMLALRKSDRIRRFIDRNKRTCNIFRTKENVRIAGKSFTLRHNTYSKSIIVTGDIIGSVNTVAWRHGEPSARKKQKHKKKEV